MYYIYIIRSEVDDSFYTGHCQNLSERIKHHNNGYTKSTKAKKPWQLVYFEEHTSRSDAVKRELQIKKQKNHQYIEELISNFTEDKIMGL